MGFFEEIQKTIQEAIDEAQGKPAQGQGQRRQQAPRQRPAPAQPEPVEEEEEEHELLSGLDRKRLAEKRRAEAARGRQEEGDRRRAESANQRALADPNDQEAQYEVKRALAKQDRARTRLLQAQAAAQTLTTGQRVRTMLSNPTSLRDAIVLREILDRPLAMRRRRR